MTEAPSISNPRIKGTAVIQMKSVLEKNIKQVINRALSIANSEPKGPVYLQATREVTAELIKPYNIRQDVWDPAQLGGLTQDQLHFVADALLKAKRPLVVTGYLGRDKTAVPQLVPLADTIKGLQFLDSNGSNLSFPADHPAWLSMRYGSHEEIPLADLILVLDCDVPWVPTLCKPSADATIIHLDLDPLKPQMPLF